MILKKFMFPALTAYALLYLVFLYSPIIFLPVFSFNDGTIVSFPLKGFTLKWYESLADAEALTGALLNSLYVALVSALLATTLGFFAGQAFARYKFKGSSFAEAIVMLPLVVPGIIVATSMLVLFIWLGFDPSLTTVIVGHVFLTVPFSVAILKSAFDQFDISLEEASRDLGLNYLETMFRVTLPVLLPGIISSFLVTFTVSFDEFVLAFFLSGNEPTLPVYIWSQIRFPSKLPTTLALATLLLLASVVLLLVAEWFRHRSEGKKLP